MWVWVGLNKINWLVNRFGLVVDVVFKSTGFFKSNKHLRGGVQISVAAEVFIYPQERRDNPTLLVQTKRCLLHKTITSWKWGGIRHLSSPPNNTIFPKEKFYTYKNFYTYKIKFESALKTLTAFSEFLLKLKSELLNTSRAINLSGAYLFLYIHTQSHDLRKVHASGTRYYKLPNASKRLPNLSVMNPAS